jgi:2-polyprenyl-6-methoxyphenol hydroxylase-like FAD-dependent oxidoreductase
MVHADFKVIVVGGGLSGLVLGNGLLNRGVPFQLFEADDEKSERDGFQIRLSAPALVGFRSCLDEDLSGQLYRKFGRSGGAVSSAPALYDSKLGLLLDLSKFPAYTKSAPITRLALRNTLSGPLKEHGKISYEKKFVRYQCFQEEEGKTRVKVFFDDGTEDVCDLLVSAEGAWSKVMREHAVLERWC